MDKRQWLIERGLAKPGRGRFSREALKALADSGLVFDSATATNSEGIEYKLEPEAPPPSVAMAPDINVPPIERDELTRKGLDDAGHVIEYSTCSRCHSSLIYCHCPNGPKAPRYVVKALDPSPAN